MNSLYSTAAITQLSKAGSSLSQRANYILKHCLHLKNLEEQQIVPTYIAHHFSNTVQ